MSNIRLTIQYDGTRYLGWQRPQKEAYHKTVSYRIKETLEKLTQEPVTLFAGAKTEPGIHALAQTVSFQTGSSLPPEKLKALLNQYLPMDISILNVQVVPERFRADLNACSRTYEYRICTSQVSDIFTSKYSVHLYPAPSLELMRRAAGLLRGRHDFGGFSPAKKKKTAQKEILDIHFEQKDSSLTIFLTANDFLYQMPSLIIGTLLEIGSGCRTPESITGIFEKKERAGAPCDTKGLLLSSIRYK